MIDLDRRLTSCAPFYLINLDIIPSSRFRQTIDKFPNFANIFFSLFSFFFFCIDVIFFRIVISLSNDSSFRRCILARCGLIFRFDRWVRSNVGWTRIKEGRGRGGIIRRDRNQRLSLADRTMNRSRGLSKHLPSLRQISRKTDYWSCLERPSFADK